MAAAKSTFSRIVAKLPDLQGQIRMVDRIGASIPEYEQDHWAGLAKLLSELYYQLQHQKQVTVFRTPAGSAAKGKRGR